MGPIILSSIARCPGCLCIDPDIGLAGNDLSPSLQNGQLSFVPEDYGKEKPPPPKRSRSSATSELVNPDKTINL